MYKKEVKMSNITDFMATQESRIGSNGEKLGKKYGNYLVYNPNSGWNIRHLNYAQQILRNWLGFYSSTHFKNVFNVIKNKLEFGDDFSKFKFLREHFLFSSAKKSIKIDSDPTTLVAIVNRGKMDVLGVASVNTYKNAKKFCPEYKGNPHFELRNFKTLSDDPIIVTVAVQCIYQQLCQEKEITAGPFGDYINIIKMAPCTYGITQIAFNAFPKPGLAADILPVFKCKDIDNQDQYIMLTGTRKFPPGQGLNATLGGFTNVQPKNKKLPASPKNPCTLVSPICTALEEGKEEAGLKIELEDPTAYLEDYNALKAPGRVTCGDQTYSAQLVNLGTIKTDDALLKDGGETLANGEKRVYATTGFVCIVDLENMKVNVNDKQDGFLTKFKLKADDDIAGLQVNNITDVVVGKEDCYTLGERMQFGIKHHDKFLSPAISAIKKYFKLNNEEVIT
jgi:hypothetical protein